jgi:hypothetical protein
MGITHKEGTWIDAVCSQMHNVTSGHFSETKSTEESSWEADSSSAGSENLRLLWNLRAPYRVYYSAPVDPIWSQLN